MLGKDEVFYDLRVIDVCLNVVFELQAGHSGMQPSKLPIDF
jgi:hypothetical protein